MTKANIELPNGTKIIVDGTPEEVAKAVQLMQGGLKAYSSPKRQRRSAKSKRKSASNKQGPAERIRNLMQEGFFKEPKSIQDVRHALAEKGHIYPITSLSTPLVRLVRSREIRRLKDNKRWTYVEI